MDFDSRDAAKVMISNVIITTIIFKTNNAMKKLYFYLQTIVKKNKQYLKNQNEML